MHFYTKLATVYFKMATVRADSTLRLETVRAKRYRTSPRSTVPQNYQDELSVLLLAGSPSSCYFIIMSAAGKMVSVIRVQSAVALERSAVDVNTFLEAVTKYSAISNTNN